MNPIFIIRFWDEAEVCISFSQREITLAFNEDKTPPETINHFLQDQIMPRILSHEGNLVLHAGAVTKGGVASVFLGESGRGKSTLVASLRQAGATLLGDDAIVVSRLKNEFQALAVYPSLRLLPDSLLELFPNPPEVTSVAHYTLKQRVSVPVPSDDTQMPITIGAFFFLAPPSSGTQITFRRMSIAESCMGLIKDSFALDPTDKKHAREKLIEASALASKVPAFELSYPRDYARLRDVHIALERQIESLHAGATLYVPSKS